MKQHDFVKETYIDKNKSFAETEVGDIKQDDFYPQIKIKRWDNEANFSVRLIKDITGSSHTKEGDKIKWISASKNTEAHFYALPSAGHLMEEGGYEFEVLLKQKPVSNILDFSIQTKELRYTYQNPLTQEEIDEGSYQPECAIGSYAVYHKSKKNDLRGLGGKNYKTGKAFHIYRPFATDSQSVSAWCNLSVDVDKETLSIIIPQNFLDNASYPILIDPTFGYTSIGGTTTTGSTNQSRAKSDTISVIADVSKVTFYSQHTSSTGDIKGAIWQGPKGDGNYYLVDAASTGTTVNTTAQWYDSTFSAEVPSGDVWVGAIWGGGSMRAYWDNDVANDGHSDTSNSYTTPRYLDGSDNDNDYSFYATYTASNKASKTYRYNAGNEAGTYWTNDSNAWDDNDSTYAERTIPTSSGKETDKWIQGTGNTAPTSSPISGYIIEKVETITRGSTETGNVDTYLLPRFGGTTSGDEHILLDLTSPSNTYIDITSDTNAPSAWSWSDVQNLDLRVYCINTDPILERWARLYEIRVRVTYGPTGQEYNESVTDTYGFAETITVENVISLSRTDTHGFAETITVENVLDLSRTDTHGFAETITAENVIPVSKTDTIGLDESISAIATFDTSRTDDIGLDESISAAATFNTSRLDDLGLDESISAQNIISTSLTDTFGIDEIILPENVIPTIVTDTIGIDEDIIPQNIISTSVSANLGLDDTITAILTVSAQRTDTLGLDETISCTTTFNPSITETLGLDEDIVAAINFVTSATDTLGLDEDIVGGLVYTVSVTDTLGLDESISAIVSFNVSVTDDLGLDETITTIATFNTSRTDDLGLDESITANNVIDLTAVDTIGLNEIISNTQDMVASLTDTIGLNESISALLQVVAAITDNLGLDDATDAVATFNPSITEEVGLSDTIQAQVNIVASVTDDLGLSETITANNVIDFSITDNIGLSEVLFGGMSHAVSVVDTLGLDESIEVEAISVKAIFKGKKFTFTFDGKENTFFFDGIKQINIFETK